eukprot:3637858-Prymnesium_polylepis.1
MPDRQPASPPVQTLLHEGRKLCVHDHPCRAVAARARGKARESPAAAGKYEVACFQFQLLTAAHPLCALCCRKEL